MIRRWLLKNKSDFRVINNLVIPMLFLQILQLFFQLGDQAIVGRLGVNEFAAVGVASSFIFLITGTIGILCVAFNIIGGRFFGQNDISQFGKAFNTSMVLSIIIGILFEIILVITGKWILKNIYNVQVALLTPTSHYLYISAINIGMNMILFNFSAYFKNIKKAKLLIYGFVAAGVVNVFFDYVFVFGKLGFPELGMSGAAVGSIVGYAVSILINMFFFYKHNLFKFSFQINKPIAKQLMKLYFPLALQDLIEYTIFAMGIMVIISKMGTEIIAAYTVLTTLLEIIMIPIYVFSGSCMTLTAQAYGKQQKNYTKYSYLSFQLMLIISVPLTLIVMLFAHPLIRIITNKEVILILVLQVLPLALTFNLINGFQMIMKSALQAIDLEKWVVIYSGLVYAVSLGIIYFFVLKFELRGIYLGFGICYLFLSIGYLYKIKKRESGYLTISEKI